MSRLDYIYRRLLLTKFFTKGWGKPDNLKRIFDFRKIMSDRELCRNLVASNYPIHIDKEYRDGDCRIVEGHFASPFIEHLPGIMPKEVETATFQMLLPVQWKHAKHKPVCIQLAGTGDHGFWRRRLLMAKPLLKEHGIASILLENPFYGSRKPKGQLRSSLHNVSDLFVMGGALILESQALLHWCQRQGFGPLGLTGVSMGGHMASLAATNWQEPISLVPCLSWSSASVIFTEGVMSKAIPWRTLETQFFENSVYADEISKLIVSPEDYNQDKAYRLGQQFVKDFSSHYDPLQEEQQHNIHSDNTGQLRHSSAEASLSSAVLTEKMTDRLQLEHSVPVMQASIGSIPHQGTGLVKSTKSQAEGSPSFSSFSSSSTVIKRDPLTLQHAASKSKLSRSAAPTKTSTSSSSSSSSSLSSSAETLRHAISKSKLSHPSSSVRRGGGGAGVSQTLKQEALDFMVGVMDECTHLGNFSVPLDPRLIIIVAAGEDAYIPRHGVMPLNKLWPGSEVRYLPNRGHIAAFLLNSDVFRKAIADSFNRQMKLHPQS